jgi:hypothetical protein
MCCRFFPYGNEVEGWVPGQPGTGKKSSTKNMMQVNVPANVYMMLNVMK